MKQQEHCEPAAGVSSLPSHKTCLCVSGSSELAGVTAGKSPSSQVASPLEPAEKQFLLSLARRALVSFVTNTSLPELLEPWPRLAQRQACFVTLSKAGVLRGCVGQLLPEGPLYRTVIENVCGAAARDPRFPMIQAGEVERLRIEISVLSEPQPLRCASPEELLERLRPHEDGVLLRIGQRVATFLPQVWDQIPDRVQFLEHLAQKAGRPPTAWRDKEAEISVYQTECFAED